MELRKSAPPLECKYGDATFLIKPQASEEDRMTVIFAERGAARCRVVVERMVIGWRGVEQDGKPVPYEFAQLENLPNVPGHNLFMDLGEFIIKNTDLQGAGGSEEIKKE